MMRKPEQGGAAMVEFAILLPVLVLVAVGVMEYGRAVYQYDTLTKSVRSAARYLSQYAAGNATAITVARNLALCGMPDCTGLPSVLPGLTAANFSVCDASNCAGTHQAQATGSGTANLVTVTLSGYAFQAFFPAMLPQISIGPIHATMRQGS